MPPNPPQVRLNDTWLVRHKTLTVEHSLFTVDEKGTVRYVVPTFHGYEVTDGNPLMDKIPELFHRHPPVGIASEI